MCEALLRPFRATGLPLGWAVSEQAGQFGLAAGTRAARPKAAKKLVSYRGDSHLVSIAPTGAGKAVSAAVPALISHAGSAVVFDPKGELASITARHRRDRLRQRVVILDPFGRVPQVQKPDRFNPLDALGVAGSSIEADAAMFAAMLVDHHISKTDPFWTDAARSFLTGLLLQAATGVTAEKRLLASVYEMLHRDDVDYSLAVDLDKKLVINELAYREIAAYLQIPSDKTRPCVLTSTQMIVKFLASPEYQLTFGKSTFDVRDLLEDRPITIYIVIPVEYFNDSQRPGFRLIVGSLMHVLLGRRVRPRQSTLLLLDEAAQLGTLDQLRTAITFARGRGLQVWTLWQDLSQLTRLYNDWPTLLNNCDVIQAFGISRPLMAEQLAPVLGMTRERLSRLAPNEAATFINGQGVRVLRKLDYRRDRRFTGCFDAHPWFMHRIAPQKTSAPEAAA